MTQKRRCEICGEYKPLSEFSKSYPHRCKPCVAESVRLSRKAKKTIPDIKPIPAINPQIDWDERRYEIAKEIMKGLASNPNEQMIDAEMKTLARWSVGGADALIEELKKGGIQ